MSEDALFDGFDDPAPERETMSDGRRLTQRQHFDISRGIHPLTKEPIPDPSPGTCGSCVFRQQFGRYPKCWRPGVPNAHSARTSVRAFWPACPGYVATTSLTEEQATRIDCGEDPAAVI